jgi:ketosteroid isomerase-like protein
VLILLTSVLLAPGQSSVKVTTQSAEEQKILQLEQEWMDAMKRRDEAALNRIMSPEFTLAGVSDFDRPPVPRAVWIDNTLHKLNVESFSFDKKKARVFGDAATVQAVYTWKGAFGGKSFTDTGVLIDTWVKQNGSWKVVSRLVGEYKKPEGTK